MFNLTDLTAEQQEQIKVWAGEGDQLADLQEKINSEFQLKQSITYLDTRFLVIDLGIELIAEAKPEEKKPEEKKPEDQPKALVPQGYVDAVVDEIVRPGFLASGKVIFSDGMHATWGLDQMGRLSVDADTADYKINDEDMIAFQEILRDKLKA